MKNIKVFGSGCKKCKKTISLIEQIAAAQGDEIVLEKIESPAQILHYGVMITPAIFIDEVLVHKGSVPTPEKVKEWFNH